MMILHFVLFLLNLGIVSLARPPKQSSVRLQIFHFESGDTLEHKSTSSYQIATSDINDKVMKTKLGIPLRLQLDYRYMIKDNFFPMELTDTICKTFRGLSPVNSFMFVNDDGELETEKFSRGYDYIIHLASSMGIPTFTWFPDKAGQYKLDKSSLAIRLEPANWHIIQAVVDFMHAYNWTRVATVVSKLIPNHQNFIKELEKAQKERGSLNDERAFKFMISQSLLIDGIRLLDLPSCKNETNICPFINQSLDILKRLHKKNDRVILFHGTKHDLMFIIKAARQHAKGSNYYLNEMFGANYIWLCSPALEAPVKIDRRSEVIYPDLFSIKGSWKIKQIDLQVPGMFVFATFNNFQSYKSKADIAQQMWVRGLEELTKFLRLHHVYNNSVLVEKLRPSNLCSLPYPKWIWGRKLYQIMKSMTLKINDEYIGFLNNGAVNTTELIIFNSQLKINRLEWHKVGSWSMSSKWGKKKSNLRIDGVTWPGNEVKPPRGRPDKFRLKITTIQEIPFVQFRETETGLCDGNTIKCWVRDLSRKLVDSSVNETFYAIFKINVTSDHPYVPACCTGLTMDMLSELMKDLEFEVDLFEVPDGKWGGWTPDGWNGLVKTLNDHLADMAVTSFKITPNRSEQIDFSVPFLQTGIAIIVALRDGGISPTAFLEPYDYQSWCVILVFSVHACGAALFIYEWLSPHGLDRGNLVTTEHKFSFFRSLWLIWSMLFGAAVNADNPRGTASRFLANIWALFALVFLASYTANLAAFMIAKDDFYDLTGIKDNHLMNPMSYKPPFTFATVPSGATEENIKINFPAMYEYMNKFNKTSVEAGIKALKVEEINAFIYDSNVLEYRATKDEHCKLKTVGNLFAMTGYGVGFPKGSKWLNLINDRILNYESSGKMQRWKQYWLTGACKKDRRLDSTNKRLGVKNFISAFILLLGGIIICSILLLLEHAFYKYLRPHLTNIDRYGCCGLVSISMGQILNFEQSVNQTVDMVKNHKCSNVFCESKFLKTKMEAEQLKRRVEILEQALTLERAENKNNKIQIKQNQMPKSKDLDSSRVVTNHVSEMNCQLQIDLSKAFDKNSDYTPTFVYECTHLQNKPKPIDKFQLACLSPSQIYKPNNPATIEKNHLLANDHDQCLQNTLLTKRKPELLEKESCL